MIEDENEDEDEDKNEYEDEGGIRDNGLVNRLDYALLLQFFADSL